MLIFHRGMCKELFNKDHATCRKERFIESKCSSLAVIGWGLYRRGHSMREGDCFWSLIICDHQMEWVGMPS
jgi:hypothetical protein